MFTGFSDKTIDFMWNIRFNNRKDWFEEHKDEYKQLLEGPMKELGKKVFDDLANDVSGRGFILRVSRIYKDARRPQKEGPYRDHLWFCIREDDPQWTDKPVFWFELQPESWSYGLGYYSARAATMEKLRRSIDADPKPLAKLARDFSRQSEFELEGEDYSRAKCQKDAPLFEFYNKKNFSLIHQQPNGMELYSPELAARIAGGMRSLIPFYDYLVSTRSVATD